MNDSYGCEGEYVGKKSRGATDNVTTTDNKYVWDIVFKVSQLVAPLILMAMVYLMIQQNGMERRLSIIEVTMRNQPVDIALVKQIAVIEDRQNAVIRRLDVLSGEFERHREASTYDSAGVTRRIPRER